MQACVGNRLPSLATPKAVSSQILAATGVDWWRGRVGVDSDDITLGHTTLLQSFGEPHVLLPQSKADVLQRQLRLKVCDCVRGLGNYQHPILATFLHEDVHSRSHGGCLQSDLKLPGCQQLSMGV